MQSRSARTWDAGIVILLNGQVQNSSFFPLCSIQNGSKQTISERFHFLFWTLVFLFLQTININEMQDRWPVNAVTKRMFQFWPFRHSSTLANIYDNQNIVNVLQLGNCWAFQCESAITFRQYTFIFFSWAGKKRLPQFLFVKMEII